MTNTELIADFLTDFSSTIHRHLDPLDAAALDWRPDPLANSIGLTVWHVSRWLDLLAVVVLQNRTADDEQWHTAGWRAKTGYDPRGIGLQGFGAITGYTAEEAAAVPAMEPPDLLAYFDQTLGALRSHIVTMSDEALYQPAPGLNGSRLAYWWIKVVLLGILGHAGEIEAMLGMRARGG